MSFADLFEVDPEAVRQAQEKAERDAAAVRDHLAAVLRGCGIAAQDADNGADAICRDFAARVDRGIGVLDNGILVNTYDGTGSRHEAFTLRQPWRPADDPH